ncbi:DEKNAAC101570 [Brettanomyces naardenensis]|uniref:Glycogen debranching enzyme n=1 Tax=Brettanomyces naardenensis TaxID=13370 RepID=A0A448YIK9_BRENA|nr:DEKNAAC101570 [Brettanomyces naardenensis]
MTRVVLLRLDDKGEPLVNGHGVLSFPAVPPEPTRKSDDPLFCLRLHIQAGSRIANNGKVWTDVPPSGSIAFSREKFYGQSILGSFDKDSTVDINVYWPGAYCYYLSYNSLDDDDNETLKTTLKFHFVVPPSLFISQKYLPLNSISMQSVISKWIGTGRDDFDRLFSEIQRKGYNMIHFTPLQARGESDSPYSICDQLEFDPALFPGGVDDVSRMIAELETRHGILSMTDVVFNHTANNSPWLREHPEAGYNLETAPHLEAAMELDALLLHFSRYMSWHGCPTNIRTTADLLKVMDGIKIHVLGQLRLWQYYVIDVKGELARLKGEWDASRNGKGGKVDPAIFSDFPPDARSDLRVAARYIAATCAVKPFGLGARYENALDTVKLAAVLEKIFDKKLVDLDFPDLEKRTHAILDEVNLPLYKEYDEDNEDILENLYNRINYQRLDSHGPQLGEVTKDSPLTEPYFTRFTDVNGRKWALANNGWIWDGNPLVDFASSSSKCYMRREVIVWGDCVKLRYGSGPQDSPYLWDRMTKYAQLCAKVFHGFRIDNCHSTPIHVGEALLDAARAIRPNLYVVAELFTGNEDLDTHFVERLGISSLIREAMQAYSVGELSRLVHRHGGRPIGSFRWLPLDVLAYPADKLEFAERQAEEIRRRSEIPVPELVTAAPTHALFMDCTHDNEMPNDKRTVEDTLPNAALVAFCACATGTTMGYDECYPHLLDLVKGKQMYTYGPGIGIGDVKAKLNSLRRVLAEQSLSDPEANEMHVHHEGQYITIHRSNAQTGEGYFLIARTKFCPDGEQTLSPIVLHGTLVKNEFAYALERLSAFTRVRSGETDTEEVDPLSKAAAPSDFITPVPVKLRTIEPADCLYDPVEHSTTVILPKKFPQGAILVLSTRIPNCDAELDKYVRTGAIEAAEELTLVDLNALLYRCESEERDASGGVDGVYDIPDFGRLVYAGLQGWVSVLRGMVASNDLAHPLAKHLRNGHWALDYIPARIAKYEAAASYAGDDDRAAAIERFRTWIESRFARVKEVPYFLVPRFFALVVGVAYEALRFRALALMSPPVKRSTVFVQSLALVSVQMAGLTRTAPLSPFSTNEPSLAAGLPHFSFDFMRCWGRDVFISLRGLLLATGRFDVAKSHILNFAMTLKHGLIPNLLGAGKEPRYNARDAVWWFLQAIQDLYHSAPIGEGDELLNARVRRRFPLDDTWVPWDDARAFAVESTLVQIIYEILSRHAAGIKFREAHAGPQIDSQMRDEGFNVEIHVDWTTGLVSGGNQFNCGTWMDKMGESVRAGNKGIPGTPRDGADVEINGLLKSALRFVIELNEKGLFPYTSITTQDGKDVTFVQWNQLLQANFEKCFYIPENPSEDKDFVVDSNIVNRRGIYKDIFGSGKPYEDYQLRGNFPIAIVVAPELFKPERALRAIDLADRVLRGPVGLKTLDPSDLNYRPYYNNSEDSNDFATSKGRNYHQGPEWVWIYGYFLRAYRMLHEKYDDRCKNESYLDQLMARRLSGNLKWLKESQWAGLAELTNKDGEFCSDSCMTQAWSASCLVDVYMDYWRGESKEHLL